MSTKSCLGLLNRPTHSHTCCKGSPKFKNDSSEPTIKEPAHVNQSHKNYFYFNE